MVLCDLPAASSIVNLKMWKMHKLLSVVLAIIMRLCPATGFVNQISSSTAQHSRLHMFGYSVFCVAVLLGLSYSVLLLNNTRCSAHGFGQPYLIQPSASYSELQKASPTNGCSMVALAHHINLEISTWPCLRTDHSHKRSAAASNLWEA
jgi:hypothetical protein